MATGNTWAETFIVREAGDPPQGRCKKEDPGKVLTSLSLGPVQSRWSLVDCTFAPQGREQLCARAKRSDGSEKERNLGASARLSWRRSTSCLPNPV